MPKQKQMLEEGKVQQMMYFDKTLLKKLKSYALETDTPFHKLIEEETNQFVQLLLAKCEKIDELRMKELEAYKKSKEERDIVEQFPMKVPGHEVDPIGSEIEPISQ